MILRLGCSSTVQDANLGAEKGLSKDLLLWRSVRGQAFIISWFRRKSPLRLGDHFIAVNILDMGEGLNGL
jgi:hypothetical protein